MIDVFREVDLIIIDIISEAELDNFERVGKEN
jgi:hypothetical protein